MTIESFTSTSPPNILLREDIWALITPRNSLAVEHALETTSVGSVPLRTREYEPATTNNPFILPWSMRGLLEEEYVRTTLQDESRELLAQFERWRPNTKVLKDVKFRLEAVKSKL